MPNLHHLSESDATFIEIKQEIYDVQMSNRRYHIKKMFKIDNPLLERRFHDQRILLSEKGSCPVKRGFHGTPHARTIADEGFDASRSHWGLYGKGVYLTPQAWRANFYAFGRHTGCARHNDQSCTSCTRLMLFCLCLMGRCFVATERIYDFPPGYHSVISVPSQGASSSRDPELFAAVHGDQVLPLVLIEYNFEPTPALPPQITPSWRVPALQEARPKSSSVTQRVDENCDYYLLRPSYLPRNPPARKVLKPNLGKVLDETDPCVLPSGVNTQDEDKRGERSSTGYRFQDLGVIIKLLLGLMVVGAFALVHKWVSR